MANSHNTQTAKLAKHCQPYLAMLEYPHDQCMGHTVNVWVDQVKRIPEWYVLTAKRMDECSNFSFR